MPAFLPAFRGSEYFTGWFPLYPLLIRAAALLARDARWAALAVSWGASAAAVLLFRRLAERFTPRPLLASALFAFFPATWLLCGSLAFVEPVFLCAALAAVLGALDRRPVPTAAAAAAAMLAQKSGVLVLPVAAAAVWSRRGRLERRDLAPLAASLIAPAALQGYLWAVFGDPLVNVRVQRDIFGGALFGVPLAGFVRGALTPSPLGNPLHRALVVLSFAFYAAAAAAGARRGRREERPLLAWLAIVLAFHACLAGPWAFWSLPRFLVLGAPPALLLLLPLVPAGDAAVAAVAVLALIPFGAGLIEAARGTAVTRAAWTPAYLSAASEALR